MNYSIEIIFFYDENVSRKETIFKGSTKEWKSAVGEKWDGFNLGDTFRLNNDKVRVFKKNESRDFKGSINNVTFWVGPAELNPNKIKHESFL